MDKIVSVSYTHLADSKVLKLTEFVTANDLAIMMDVPINNVIATCMNLGVMVSINQRLDADVYKRQGVECAHGLSFYNGITGEEVVELVLLA